MVVVGEEADMFDAKALLNVVVGGLTGKEPPAAAAEVDAAIEQGRQAAEAVANQALARTRQAAGDAAAALSGALGQAQSQLKGSEAADYVGKAKDIVDRNPLGSVAALGGLAAILLGTEGGRSLTGNLVKLGGLAAIGGLAYKALRNYQEGKPLSDGVPGLESLRAAPEGSAFAETAHTQETARLLVRAMVATAAADGTVDAGQRQHILAEMKGAGLEAEAAEFLEQEIRSPATLEELAKTADRREIALQVYAAAQLVASNGRERAFLDQLGQALHLEPPLVAEVGALTRALSSAGG
jgi:uncharacterized membrane protein YebE (DUF533 family)